MKLYLLDRSYIEAYLDKVARLQEQASTLIQDFKPTQRSYEVNGSQAQIPVLGPLQRSEDFMSWIFGSSTYDEIATMTQEADQDPDVSSIAYMINSPGGEVDGVDILGQTIKAANKPTVAYVDNMALSAAYWIASQTDKIIATSPTAEFGSIGVIVAGWDLGGILEAHGAKRILITSTDAPEKKLSYRLDTSEGEASMIKRLDAMHEVFAQRVADGRNTTVANVNENFGRGGVVPAKEALTKGLIDNIDDDISLQNIEKEIESTSINGREAIVDKKELLEKHPDIIAQIEKESHDKGVASGIASERKRVEDLSLWRSKGDECSAIVDEAIKSGASFTDVQSKLCASASQEANDDNPPILNEGKEVKIAEGDDRTITDEKASEIGKDIARNLAGGI